MSDDVQFLHKPSAAIQLTSRFQLGEQKLLNFLMYHAQVNSMMGMDKHRVPLKEVFAALGWRGSKNVDKIKGYMTTLITTGVYWNEFDIDRSTEWEMCTFLSGGAIESGTLRYTINANLVEHLRHPIIYAKILVLAQGNLSKKNSLLMYEYLLDSIGRGAPLTNVSLEKLIRFLGLLDTTYAKNFKFFRRDVLDPVVKELNEHTDLEVSWTPIKTGRKITAVCFMAKRDELFQLPLQMGSLDNEEDLVARLVESGVSPTVAVKLVRQYDYSIICRQLEHLEKNQRGGAAIKNPGAWLKKAIQENWAISIDEPANPSNPAAARQAEQEAKFAQVEERKAKLLNQRYEDAWEAFKGRSATFKTRRINAFIKKLQADGNTIVLKKYETTGFDSGMVRGCFMTEALMNDLLGKDSEAQ